MSHDSPQLLQSPEAADSTPSLFSREIMDSITTEEAQGIYTAERCPEDKRKAIVELLGRGWPKRRIQELVHVHRLTINQIELQCCSDIDAVRLRIGTRAMRCASDQLERLEENPGLVPGSSIAMTVSMLAQTAELLAGRPTARVEHVEAVDIYGDWEGFIEKQLPPENVREIGLAGEKKLAIESGDVIDGELADPGRSDGGSEHSEHDAQRASDRVTTSVTSQEIDERSGNQSSAGSSKRPEETPGGGSADGGEAKSPTHQLAQKNFSNRSS